MSKRDYATIHLKRPERSNVTDDAELELMPGKEPPEFDPQASEIDGRTSKFLDERTEMPRTQFWSPKFARANPELRSPDAFNPRDRDSMVSDFVKKKDQYPFQLKTENPEPESKTYTAFQPSKEDEKEESQVEEKVEAKESPQVQEVPKESPPENAPVGDRKKTPKEEKQEEKESEDTSLEEKTEEPVQDDPNAEDAGSGEETPPADNNDDAGADENPAADADPGGGGGSDAGGGDDSSEKPEVPELDASDSPSLLKSLSTVKPTLLADGLKQAKTKTTEAFGKEQEKAQEKLPEVEQPTGLPTLKSKKDLENQELEKSQEPELEKEGEKDGVDREVKVEHKDGAGPPPKVKKAPKISVPKGDKKEESTSFWDRIFGKIKGFLGGIVTKDDSVNTKAGKRPKVDTTGDADPQLNQQNKQSSGQSVQQDLQNANEATKEDRGENDLFPEIETQTLETDYELSKNQGPGGGKLESPELTGDVRAALDAGLQSKMDETMSEQLNKNEADFADFEAKADKEHKDGLEKIRLEDEKVRKEQEQHQKDAKDSVKKERENWESENKKVREDYDKKVKNKRLDIDGKIDKKIKDTDKDANDKLTAAENEADNEKKKAEAKAAAEKKKKQNKKRSWWDKLKDAVSSVLNAIREAVNAIFEGLRALVKTIIEAAKKAVKGLIELARKAIVGLIKAFGEALKAFVSVALAAFPELRKKALAKIDQAVNTAVKAVNDAAQALKDFADAVLDAIGAAIDAVLSAYQALFNAVMDVVEFLVIGLLEIMEGIANLVKAAIQSPDFFFGQASEELLGTDVTQPLPNEYPAAAMNMAGGGATATSGGSEGGGSVDLDSLNKEDGQYSASDFDVPVQDNFELPPAIAAQLQGMGDGEVEFGASNDNDHGVDSLKSDIADEAATEMESPASEGGEQEGAEMMPGPDPNRDIWTPDANGMVGPFTAMQRAGFVTKQMLSAIKDWFAENWPMILAGVVAGITGIILANIATGGAIMAALPLVMQLVSAYFAAETIVNMGKHFKNYLGSAWPGAIAEGAKSFARALAIGAIEVVTALVFAPVKAVKGLAKGAKALRKGGVKGLAKTAGSAAKSSVKKGIKETVGAAKELGQVAKRGGKALMKNGKMVVKGVRKGMAKGAKTLDDFGKRLGKALRFKKFKIQVKNRRFKLFGQINPWVLLANGKLEFIDDPKMSKKVGSKVDVDGVDGIVVGVRNTGKKSADEVVRGAGDTSKYVDDLLEDAGDPDKLKKIYSDLNNADDPRKLINGRSEPAWLSNPDVSEAARNAGKQRDKLRKNLNPGAGENAHHLVPVEALGKNKVVQDAVDAGFDFNGAVNGKNLKRYSSESKMVDGVEVAGPKGVHASHGNYSAGIDQTLNDFAAEMGEELTPAQSKLFCECLAETSASKMDDLFPGMADGNKVNNLFNEAAGGISQSDFYDEVYNLFRKRMRG